MKTITKILHISLFVLLFIQCAKDETVQNQPPGSFNVTPIVTENSAIIDWNAPIDPEGSPLTYTVMLDGQTIVSTQTETTHSFTDLAYASQFSGTVVAYDAEGLSSEAEYDFETGIKPNTAPMIPVLLTPSANEESVALIPELSWSEAIDAENDPVFYEIFMDETPNPTTKIDENVATTSYTLINPLKNNATYYWKVVARDNLDATSESKIQSFTTRDLVIAVQVTDDGGFPARGGHTSLVFDDKMWVIGGSSCCGGRYNDVWSSIDGVTWTQVTSNAKFPARNGHASVVYDNKMWVIGGNSSSGSSGGLNDIWYSSDGVDWIQVTDHIDINGRYGHKMLVYDNKMWMLGGRDNSSSYSSNQVWFSENESDWQLLTDNAGINFDLSQFAVFDNKIWRIGNYNDTNIYSTTDGKTWTLEAENAPFGQRHNHSLTVWDDKIWLLSGSDKATNELFELDDVWFSEDGVTWQLAADNAGYTATAFHTSVTYADKIWKIAGSGGWQSFEVWNDIWSFEY